MSAGASGTRALAAIIRKGTGEDGSTCLRSAGGRKSRGRWSVEAMVSPIDDAETLQREQLVDFADGAGLGSQQWRQPSGGQDLHWKCKLARHPLADAVHKSGIAEDQPGLHRVDGVSPDDGRRPGEFHARQARRILKEGFHGNGNPRRNAPTQVLPLGRHRIEGGGRPEIHHHQALVVLLECRDGIDDAVGPHLAGVVVEDGHPRLHARSDEQWTDAKIAFGHVLQGKLHRWDDAGDHQRPHQGWVDAGVRQRLAHPQAVLVRGAPGVGGQSPVVDEARPVKDADYGVGVADVDGEQHRPGKAYHARGGVGGATRARTCSTSPASTRTSEPSAVRIRRAPSSSMSTATPRISRRSEVTRTSWPSVADKARHRSRTGWNPSAACNSGHSSRRSESPAANGARGTVCPVTLSALVATWASSGGKSAAAALRLTPMPSTTKWTRSGSAESSVRMPATLRPPTSKSFGHLMSAGTPNARRDSATATAARSVSSGARCGGNSGRSTKEQYRFRCRGEDQLRP